MNLVRTMAVLFLFLLLLCFILDLSPISKHGFLIPGVFDVLAYTDTDVAVPFTWIESDPKLIENPQMVKLHSFDTKVNLDLQFGCLSYYQDLVNLAMTNRLFWLADSQG